MSYTAKDASAATVTFASTTVAGAEVVEHILVDDERNPVSFIPPVQHGADDDLYPLKIGARVAAALTALTALVTGKRTDLIADTEGVLLVRPHAPPGDHLNSGLVTCTGGAEASAIAAQGAGIKFAAVDIEIKPATAAAGYVDLRDGSGGTVLKRIPYSADGAVRSFQIPVKTSPNTALFVDPSGAADVYVCVGGFKTKV